jgi:hypothetical protein
LENLNQLSLNFSSVKIHPDRKARTMGEHIFKKILWCIVLLAVTSPTLGYEVLHAVNFGANGQQSDSNGLVYQADTSCQWFWTPNNIHGTSAQNVPIYSHFCTSNILTFEIPLLDMKDGSYVLVLRLLEDVPSNLVSVQFNGHKHLENFSIHNVVGWYHAYDEHIYFSICDGQVLYKSEKSSVQHNTLRITMETMIASGFANLSAMVLVIGDVENFPKLASNPNSAESESSKMALTTHRCETDNNINKNITSIVNHGTMNINIHIN